MTELYNLIIESKSKELQNTICQNKYAEFDINDVSDIPVLMLTNDINTINVLIQAGADVNAKNSYGKTPLMKYRRNLKIINLLLDSGADVSIKNNEGNTAYDINLIHLELINEISNSSKQTNIFLPRIENIQQANKLLKIKKGNKCVYVIYVLVPILSIILYANHVCPLYKSQIFV